MSELNSSNGHRPSTDGNSQISIESEDGLTLLDLEKLDPIFQRQVEQLYRSMLYRRWLLVVVLWLTVGIYSVRELRHPISLIYEDFTWAAVRYSIGFQPIPAFGLFFCLLMTISTLFRQIYYRYRGVPKAERRSLERKVRRIRQRKKSRIQH
jgi:hypothetical protein